VANIRPTNLDGHVDLPVRLRVAYNNHIYHDNFTVPFEEGGMNGAVDLPRLKEGGSGGFFWSVFAPCPAKGDDFSDENYASSKRPIFEMVMDGPADKSSRCAIYPAADRPVP
jgi:membrane dipeptidase